MCKKIDLTRTVSELTDEYPEIKGIMEELGFKDIIKPMALSTAGKIMTIPRGASVKGIEMSAVIKALHDHGFEIESGNVGAALDKMQPMKEQAAGTPEKRMALLKSYVSRLSGGEALEDVRSDFVNNFKSVDAAEIAKAEQELIQSGTPVPDVQRLCDVHSALFHGATRQEQIDNAEAAVMDSLDAADCNKASINPATVKGHPVSVFMAENVKIMSLAEDIKKALDDNDGIDKNVSRAESLRAVSVHYARKGDLIYPLLSRTYGFSGPSEVMWGVDDEIRDELKLLSEAAGSLADFNGRLLKVTVRAEEMVYKENNILYPLCIQKFSEKDWMRIYYEMPSYDTLLTDGYPLWEEAEKRREELKVTAGKMDGYVPLGSGHMTPEQILAVLNTIPMEISFVDEGNINRFFNSGEKLFKRPDMAVGRKVSDCHPPKYEVMVRQIIDSFRSGRQDHVDVWMNKCGEPVLVKYMAVKGGGGRYLGTLECVQRMGFAEEHFKK